MLLVFDWDGTLSDPRHREHLIKNQRPEWNAFNYESRNDPPIPSMLATFDMCVAGAWGTTARIEI